MSSPTSVLRTLRSSRPRHSFRRRALLTNYIPACRLCHLRGITDRPSTIVPAIIDRLILLLGITDPHDLAAGASPVNRPPSTSVTIPKGHPSEASDMAPFCQPHLASGGPPSSLLGSQPNSTGIGLPFSTAAQRGQISPTVAARAYAVIREAAEDMPGRLRTRYLHELRAHTK